MFARSCAFVLVLFSLEFFVVGVQARDCDQELIDREVQEDIEEIKVERALKLLGEQETIVIDVRRPLGEFPLAHIEGSINIPHHFEPEERDKLPDLERIFSGVLAAANSRPQAEAILLVCRTGNRAGVLGDEILMDEDMALAFSKLGMRVYNLVGGIEAWLEKGLPTSSRD